MQELLAVLPNWLGVYLLTVNVVLSSQDPALVLPLWHPGYSGGAAGAGGLAVAALNEHPKNHKRTAL